MGGWPKLYDQMLPKVDGLFLWADMPEVCGALSGAGGLAVTGNTAAAIMELLSVAHRRYIVLYQGLPEVPRLRLQLSSEL